MATIVATTERIVQVRQAREPLADLARRAERCERPAGRFLAAVAADDRINIVAECKRRSPSRGVLRANYDVRAIATSYAEAGAAAISVLTEPSFFDGSLADLEAVRTAVDLPLLRKDFVVSEYQLFEAKAAGADAVLLIVSALAPTMLAVLMRRAKAIGLDTLVEVHDLSELERALDASAQIIGVNNRNLRTLAVDMNASETLISAMPREVVAISESGLRGSADLLRLRDLGYRAFLIGERLVTASDPGAGLRAILDGCRLSASASSPASTAKTNPCS
ncbi:MAG: indole-3-glycerol phosphate synthase TrpC [Blastocatellia bacterium]|nr:MAG: indole-3-glycerol phosphate synthase TrpC [Blastocatellia bacterium]